LTSRRKETSKQNKQSYLWGSTHDPQTQTHTVTAELGEGRGRYRAQDRRDRDRPLPTCPENPTGWLNVLLEHSKTGRCASSRHLTRAKQFLKLAHVVQPIGTVEIVCFLLFPRHWIWSYGQTWYVSSFLGQGGRGPGDRPLPM
jgi:hypothetical protein